MTTEQPRKISVRAAFGAVMISSLITSIISVLPLSVVFMLPEGAVQKAALILSCIVIAVFFVWFTQHAYHAELTLLAEGSTSYDEDLGE